MGAGQLETLLDAVQGDPQSPALICAGEPLTLRETPGIVQLCMAAYALRSPDAMPGAVSGQVSAPAQRALIMPCMHAYVLLRALGNSEALRAEASGTARMHQGKVPLMSTQHVALADLRPTS